MFTAKATYSKLYSYNYMGACSIKGLHPTQHSSCSVALVHLFAICYFVGTVSNMDCKKNSDENYTPPTPKETRNHTQSKTRRAKHKCLSLSLNHRCITCGVARCSLLTCTAVRILHMAVDHRM